MKMKLFSFFVFLFVCCVQNFAQNNQPVPANQQITQPPVSMEEISAELIKISKSLQVFNKNFKAYLDKLPQGVQFNEKQQNLLIAFEILNRAEERLAVLQKFQIDLTEKQADLKIRLLQVEENLSPEGIDRSVALIGTTRTQEIRDGRRTVLTGERNNLRQVLSQINQNMSENADEVRSAADFVRRLRSRILPQIEREVSNSQ